MSAKGYALGEIGVKPSLANAVSERGLVNGGGMKVGEKLEAA